MTTTHAYQNPFAGKSPAQIYELFDRKKRKPSDSGPGSLPLWPEDAHQAGYTSSIGADCVRRGLSLVDTVAADQDLGGANWKGLDYGCGWGRLASLFLKYGPPEQYDLCDAWQRSLELLGQGNFRNRVLRVPELLEADSLPADHYDFITSYSVFTHLRPDVFANNVAFLQRSLKRGGTLYLTVRHEDFIFHMQRQTQRSRDRDFYRTSGDQVRDELRKTGSYFMLSGGAMEDKSVFGDTMVTTGFLGQFGDWRYLGAPFPLQHFYAIRQRDAAPAVG
jgi:hypothetical protein